MGHIQDRWYKKVTDSETKDVKRVRTSLYGKGMRYKVRYLDPDGNERSKMFPDRSRKLAEDFLVDMESKVRGGSYIDPTAGKVMFKSYATTWLEGQSFEENTRQTTESRLHAMTYPSFRRRNSVRSGRRTSGGGFGGCSKGKLNLPIRPCVSRTYPRSSPQPWTTS